MFKRIQTPIPWAVIDAYKNLILSPETEGEDTVVLMMAAAQHCGVEIVDPLAAVLRLENFYSRQKEETSKAGPRVSIGTDFNEWCQKSSIPELLLLANKHDYYTALQMYETVDFEEVHDFLNHFLTCYGKEKRYEMEVVMYGMGGHYKEDKQDPMKGDANTQVIDLNSTQGREDARARLKSLGF